MTGVASGAVDACHENCLQFYSMNISIILI